MPTWIECTCKPFRAIVLTALAGLLAATQALGAESSYPDRPITLIIPYGAKSDTHKYGEILAKYAKKHANSVELVLENRVGDSGAKAASEVMLSKGDGYTLFLGRVGLLSIAPALHPKLPYRAKDFTFLNLFQIDPLVCVVRADSPYKTHRELTQAIRQSPGKLRFGHSGTGTIIYLSSQYFMKLSGLKSDSARAVSFGGGPEMVDALIAGELDFLCSNTASMVEPIQAGKLRGLFTTAPGRIPELPTMQNAREVGLRDMTAMLGWSVLVGPVGLPSHVVTYWKSLLKEVSTDPQWVAEVTELGAIPAIGTSKDNEKFVQSQSEMYVRLVTTLGLRE